VLKEDFDDEQVLWTWLKDQRTRVVEYLLNEHVLHGGVADRPAWYVAPCLALWSVDSRRAPGRAGWWAVSGDVPTDYVSSADAKTARDAMRVFANQWEALAKKMLCGESDADMRIGARDQWPELAPLLSVRAKLLRRVAADDSHWSGDAV